VIIQNLGDDIWHNNCGITLQYTNDLHIPWSNTLRIKERSGGTDKLLNKNHMQCLQIIGHSCQQQKTSLSGHLK